MRVDYTDDQVQLRDELRAYFANVLTPEVKAELRAEGHGGPVHREVRQKLGADGWLGIGWPTQYGGQGRSVLDQFVFFDEASRAGAPVPMIALNTVGPTIMAAGTEEQKQRYLPGILAGTLDFAIGYTEPGSGTDLASLRRASCSSVKPISICNTLQFGSRGGHLPSVRCRRCPRRPDRP